MPNLDKPKLPKGWKLEEDLYLNPEGKKYTQAQFEEFVRIGVVDLPEDLIEPEFVSTDIGRIPRTGFVSELRSGVPLEEYTRTMEQLAQGWFRGPRPRLEPLVPVSEDINRMLAELGYEGEPIRSLTATGARQPFSPFLSKVEAWEERTRTEWARGYEELKGVQEIPELPVGIGAKFGVLEKEERISEQIVLDAQIRRMEEILRQPDIEPDVAEMLTATIGDVRAARAIERIYPYASFENIVNILMNYEDEFLGEIRRLGKTVDTVALLGSLYGDIPDEQIDEFFSLALWGGIPEDIESWYHQRLSEIFPESGEITSIKDIPESKERTREQQEALSQLTSEYLRMKAPAVQRAVGRAVVPAMEILFAPFTITGMAIKSMFTTRGMSAEEIAIRDEWAFAIEVQRERMRNGEITEEEYVEIARELNARYMPLLPTDKEMERQLKEEYEALPWWQQLLWESPAWAAAGMLSISAISEKLATGGTLSQAAATALELTALPTLERAMGVATKYAIKFPIQQATTKVITPSVRKLYETALDAGLDKWIVRQGIRGNQANKVIQYFLQINKAWFYRTAQENLIKNMAKRRGVEQVVRETAEAMVKESETLLLAASRDVAVESATEGLVPEVASALMSIVRTGKGITEATLRNIPRLEKTPALITQLIDRGFAIADIDAMTPAKAWLNLVTDVVKEVPIEAVVPKITKPLPQAPQEEGVYRVGDEFTAPEGKVTLDYYAPSKTKWNVIKPDNTREFMSIKQLDTLTDPIAGTWKKLPAKIEGMAAVEARIEAMPFEAAMERVIPIPKEKAPPVEPRPSVMIKNLSEALNVPIRRGHIRGKPVGIYKEGKEIIRINKGQMRTATHEAGHLLNERYKISKDITNAELAPLLKDYGVPLNKIKNKKSEAFAEFIRLYTTSPTKVRQVAPKFLKRFEGWLDSYPDVKDVLLTARKDYSRWTNLPPSARVRSQLSLEPDKSGRDIGRALRKLYTAAYDELHPIRHFVKIGQKSGLEVAYTADPYITARMLRGEVGKSNVFLEQGTFSREFWKKVGNRAEAEYKGKSLKNILKPVELKLDDFRIYLVSRRAVNLSGRGIDTGIDISDAKASMEELSGANPEFEVIAEELYVFQRHLLEYVQESGLISEETLGKILDVSIDYVPFYRVFEGLGRGGHFGKRMANLYSPVKGIKGSERDIVDPLESIVKNVYTMMDAADRNMVGVQMADMAEKDMRLAQMFEKIPTPMAKVAEVTADDLGVDFIDRMTGEEVETALKIFRPSMFNPKDNVLTVMIDGKKKFFHVEEELYRALSGLGQEDLSVIIKMLSYPAKWLRAGAVLSPDFWLIKNPFRDTLSAFVYSHYGFIPFVDTVRGTWSMIAKDKDYNLWRAAGGERSMMVSLDREYLQKNFKEVLSGKRKIDYFKHPLSALQTFAEFTESGTRIGEFKRALRKGVTPTEAAFASREVTLDFAVMGEKLKAWNMITAFFNANMRAMDKLVREATQSPMSFWPKVIIGITIPSIMLYLMNRDDPRWDEIPQWEKDLFWIFFLGDNIIRIPKPFEVGIMFGSVPERILEYQDTKDPKVLREVFNSMMASANPGLLPTAMTPLIEIFTNWNFFLGREIVPRSQQDLPDELQYSPYTPELIKKFGDWINFSPRKISNLIRGYTAGLGDYLIRGVDSVLRGTGILPDIPKPSPTLKDMPLIKAIFVRDPYGSGSQSVTDFYDKYEELTKGEGFLKRMLEEGNQEKYDSYLKAHPELMFFYDYEEDSFYSASARFMREIGRALSEIRNKQGEIYIDPDMSPEEKRKLIDELNKQMTEAAKLALGHLVNMPEEFTDDGNYVPAVEQTSLYDYIETLPVEISHFIWDREKDKSGIEYGHLTELVSSWDERDSAIIDNFYLHTKDWKSGDREDYRADHPDLDAALYFWGNVETLQSLEAYDKAVDMLEQIDMPIEEMEGYIPRDLFKLQLNYSNLLNEEGKPDTDARVEFRRNNSLLDANFYYSEATTTLYSLEAYDMVVALLKKDNKRIENTEGFIYRPIFKLTLEYDALRHPEGHEKEGESDSDARELFRRNNRLIDAYFVYAKDYTPIKGSGWDTVRLSEIIGQVKLGGDEDVYITSDKEPRDIGLIWIPIRGRGAPDVTAPPTGGVDITEFLED